MQENLLVDPTVRVLRDLIAGRLPLVVMVKSLGGYCFFLLQMLVCLRTLQLQKQVLLLSFLLHLLPPAALQHQ